MGVVKIKPFLRLRQVDYLSTSKLKKWITSYPLQMSTMIERSEPLYIYMRNVSSRVWSGVCILEDMYNICNLRHERWRFWVLLRMCKPAWGLSSETCIAISSKKNKRKKKLSSGETVLGAFFFVLVHGQHFLQMYLPS